MDLYSLLFCRKISNAQITSILLIVILHVTLVQGNLEPTLSRCCSLGANWGKEKLICSSSNFTTPVAGIAAEQLGVCLSAVEICCLRTHRERHCVSGKEAARAGLDCTISTDSGGEFHKDCCEACKLGLIAASMAMDCNFHSFKFGEPWDETYVRCCQDASDLSQPSRSHEDSVSSPTSRIPQTKVSPLPATANENLCETYPGELCADICISIPGSYVCECREGFTLMADRKTCQQEKIPNRCKITNPCAQQCLDTGVAIECSCYQGYQLGTDNRSCDDINECASEDNFCQYHGLTCRNKIGSYLCITSDGAVLEPGQVAPVGTPSVTSQGSHASRNDVEIGRCPTGYQQNFTSKLCDDIDECLLSRNKCPTNSTCKNTIGSFTCTEKSDLSCALGYQLDDSSQECVDIDECSLQIDNCREKKQFCINTIGSFVCEGKLPTRQCPAGYKYNSSHRTCEDVDECAENIHSCQAELEVCRNTKGGFECDVGCDQGFLFKANEGLCVDLDECLTGSYTCPTGETCFNTVGAYECHVVPSIPPQAACSAGYKTSPGSIPCVDIDECHDGAHVCSIESEICINEPGGYRCDPVVQITATLPPVSLPPQPQCQPGFDYSTSEQRCVDVDECISNDNPCDSYQVCKNKPGSFTCDCKLGFEQDSETLACVDLNECQANRHECHDSQRCDNTIGSYQCIRFTSCGTGYTLNAQTGFCEDDDECALKTDNCRALGPLFQCKNTLGSFRCQRKRCDGNKFLSATGECITQDCPSGFKPNEHGQCTDINECSLNPCRSNQRCVNKVGSYICESNLDCGRGYEVNIQGNQCIDIDECIRGTHQCPQGQLCQNRPGSYVCQCLPGYSINNAKQCVDIDECLLFRGKLQVCSSNSECQNVPGSYRCVCKEGFRNDQDDKVCSDIDECNTPNLCQHNCINIWGSFRCTCNSGFLLHSDNRSCRDIDECEEFKDRNLCVGLCVNTPGSYACRCPNGYRMGSDGRTCVDIDECSAGNVCRRQDEVCLNTRGSHFCNTIECPPNYVREQEHKNRCKRNLLYCPEGDNECIRMPQTLSFNYITFISKMTIPPIGYLDLFTMRGPMWQSTSVRFTLDLVNSRAPQDIPKATKENFRMRRTSFNQAIISLIQSIKGPQQIELNLTMDLHHNGVFGGTVVAKLFIIVSEYEF